MKGRVYIFYALPYCFGFKLGPPDSDKRGRCQVDATKALPHAQHPADSFSEPEGFGLHLISAQVPFIRPILKTGISLLVSG